MHSGSPRHHFQPTPPPTLLHCIQVMGRTVPATSLPRRPLYLIGGYDSVASGVPSTRAQPRLPRQELMAYAHRV